MMKNLRNIVLLFFSMVILQHAKGQEKTNKTPAERASMLTDWMKTNLSLTDAQVPQVQEINLKYANKNEEIKHGNLSKMQKLKAVKADDKAKDSELSAVLNADQFKNYQAKKAELKEKFKEEAKKKKNQ